MGDSARLTVMVSGQVQGVGFRDWVRQQAEPRGLAGSVTNLRDGRVQVIAEGERDAVAALLTALHGGDAPGSVTDVVESWNEPRGESGFQLC